MEQAEKKPSLADQFEALKIKAIYEIRTNGDEVSAENPKEAFDRALAYAEDELMHGNDIHAAVLYLTDYGISVSTAASILMIWKRFNDAHPDAVKKLH